jgi:hypothetical protein
MLEVRPGWDIAGTVQYEGRSFESSWSTRHVNFCFSNPTHRIVSSLTPNICRMSTEIQNHVWKWCVPEIWALSWSSHSARRSYVQHLLNTMGIIINNVEARRMTFQVSWLPSIIGPWDGSILNSNLKLKLPSYNKRVRIIKWQFVFGKTNKCENYIPY